MSGLTKSLLIASAVVAAPLLANAEGVEREWGNELNKKVQRPAGVLQGFLPARSTTKKPTKAPVSDTKAPVSNIKQPDPPVLQGAPVKVSKSRKLRKRRKAARPVKVAAPVVSQAPGRRGKQGKWWETIGNPPVFAFRDCSVKYAQSQIAAGHIAPAAELITAGMKQTCRLEFAKMAGVLLGGLGEAKSNRMLRELAKTTFLPAVSQVVAKEQQKRQVAQAKQHNSASQELAKQAMFKCFIDKTDMLSVAKSTSAATIADSVILGCQNKADAFFDLLLANSKASAAVKEKQKNIALNETYRQAIIKRILVTRGKAQLKTATGQ